MSTTDETTPVIPATTTKPKKTILQDIEAPIVWVGTSLSNLFKKESPAIQADIKIGVGILQTIKTDVAAGGVVLTYLIQKAYPQYSEAQLQDLLTKGLTYLTGGAALIGTTLTETLTNIANYAGTLTGVAHNSFWSSFAQLVVTELQPGLAWSKVATLVEWAYQTFFAPKAA